MNTIEILIENNWIEFDKSLLIKKPYRKNFSTFYKNFRISKETKIKFVCSKCKKQQINSFYNFQKNSDCLCVQCKITNTKLERYGVENWFQIKSIHQKAIKKSTTKEAREKYKKTNLEKYGREYNLSDTKTKQESMMKKYGVSHPMQSEEFKSKLRTSYWDKLKDEDYNNQVVANRRKTCLEKYGVDSSPKSDIAKQSAKNTFNKNYGVDHPMQIKEIYEKVFLNQKRSWGIKIYDTIFGDKIHYQSNYELLFIKDCENKNIRVLDGPSIPYVLHEQNKMYHIDFETEKYLIEIKGSNQFYYETLESGEIEAKNKAALLYAASINKEFLFLLDKTELPES